MLVASLGRNTAANRGEKSLKLVSSPLTDGRTARPTIKGLSSRDPVSRSRE